MAGLDVAVSLSTKEPAGERDSQPDGQPVGQDPGTLPGFYERYPASDGPLGVELQVEQIPGFARGREPGPEYPGFARRMVGPGEIELSRYDAEGVLSTPTQVGEPVRGHFRVGDSKNSLEAVIRIAMSVALPRLGGLLMHASAIEVRGEAHIFAGISGAGKSTISSMLAQSWSGCTKLSDELLIVAPCPAVSGDDASEGAPDDRLAVYVTPFIGSQGLPHGRHVPVRALYFLNQAPDHRCEAMSRTDGLRELLRHVLVYVAEPGTAGHVLAAAARLVGEITCYQLFFAKDPGVASVLAVT